MVTITDVARHAGVAPSTVSYVLSGKRAISATTRQRVLSSIRVLGYHPHAGARALALLERADRSAASGHDDRAERDLDEARKIFSELLVVKERADRATPIRLGRVEVALGAPGIREVLLAHQEERALRQRAAVDRPLGQDDLLE